MRHMKQIGDTAASHTTLSPTAMIFSSDFQPGDRDPHGVIRHFSRGRERYSVFVRNLFVADSDVVNVFSGTDAT